LPNFLYLEDELVTVKCLEKRKRKKGAAIDQVYYILEDGRCKHASFFRKVDIKLIKREWLITQLLEGN
jgi:hypothetical protein